MIGCRQLCMQTALKVARSLSEELSDAGIESTRFPSLHGLQQSAFDPFNGFETIYLQEKYFKENFPYIVSSLHVCFYLIVRE